MAVTPLAPTTGSKALRKDLGVKLGAALGKGWVIFPDEPPVNTITKPTLILERAKVEHGVAMGLSKSTYTLVAISNQVIANSREDYLDDLIDQVMGALDELTILWSTAERAVWNGTNPAYKITFTATNTRSTTP